MSRRTAAKPARVPAIITEHGLGARFARGQVEVDAKADDPEDPHRNVIRPRLHDPVRLMVSRGQLQPCHWVAAEKFRDDHALAEGCKEQGGGGTPGWARCYSDRQLDAITARAAALQAVGLRLSAVFVASVLECEPIRATERRLRLRNGTVTDLLAEALEKLADHYSKPSRAPAPK